MMRARRIIEGLTVVAVGGVLLATTFDALSWRVWLSVFALWPLLIVAFGIDLVGKGLRREWIRVFASLLVLGGFVYGVVAAAASGAAGPQARRGTAPERWETIEYVEPAQKPVRRGVARVRGGVGTVRVEEGDALVRARGAAPFTPKFEDEGDGVVARVDVSLGSAPWPWTNRAAFTDLDVELSSRVPWDLTVEAGAAELVADLSDLELSKARIEAGVSDSHVTFGAPDGVVPVEVEAGLSSTVLRFPRDSAFRISVQGALASVEAEGIDDLGSVAGTRTFSHGAGDAPDRYEVTVQAGLSTMRIELY
ncbi:MAG: DUF5668 domain-containing protein [Anaerosomatales bacterium]|nr:DUF5668 domain-containing protein [Anaerosomatales bacterium]